MWVVVLISFFLYQLVIFTEPSSCVWLGRSAGQQWNADVLEVFGLVQQQCCLVVLGQQVCVVSETGNHSNSSEGS